MASSIINQFAYYYDIKWLKYFVTPNWDFTQYFYGKLPLLKGLTVPFQLTTEEALIQAKRNLNENGIVITNIISALDGKNANFIKYEYATYKKVFKDVKIFKVQNGMFNDDELQNLILVGFKGNVIEKNDEYNKYKNLLKNEVLDFSSDKNVVTDELCPVGV